MATWQRKNIVCNKKKSFKNGALPPKSKSPKRHYLNFGEEDQMEIMGYSPHRLKGYLILLAYILTLGVLRLIFHWYPHWKLFCTHSPDSLESASTVLIVDNYKGKYKSYFVKHVEIVEPQLRRAESIISINGLIFKENEGKHLMSVYLCDGTTQKLSQGRLIKCKKLTYIWDNERQKFFKLAGLDKGLKNSDFKTFNGYTKEEQYLKRITYGTNEINVPVKSVLTLLVLEALTPFYIFQLFSLVVWLCENYYYYTTAIIIMSVFGISTSIIQTRRNQKNLKGTVHSTDKVFVSRGEGHFEEIPTTSLVPGDLIAIPPHGCEMQCDAVLLNGNCIVNESMLTGESVPITKTALPNNNQTFNIKEHSNHILFSGTKVIQTRYYENQNVLAVVVRTGYLTTKGQLIRSILYPPPADFKFDQDSYKFIMILSFIAILGFLYTVFTKYSRGITPLDILIKALDLVTIAIPPALPAAMTVGKLYALNRLKKNKIFCINSRVINVSGSVNCVCFDKTGTLTEDGLDMWGVVPVEKNIMGMPIREFASMPADSPLFRGMLTCHSLTIIDGNLCGDPLDVKMFEATGWTLEEPTVHDTAKYDLLVPTIVKNGHLEMGIIQQYQFSSSLQRMSVIAKRLDSPYFDVYCKGSPEMVLSLSKSETIPPGVWKRLQEYTEQGYRVIGMATRVLKENFHKISKLHREEVERDLNFVGLIILENRLKPETEKVIDTLRNAGMKIIMITGDNIQTAVSVARECGIIEPNHSVIDVRTTKPTKFEVATVHYYKSDTSTIQLSIGNDIEKFGAQKRYHLVINGNSWTDINQYFPELVPKIVTKGAVFARMSGLQKQQLIEELQNLGYYVAMCGDGANDCGALKAAHVGISLSEAESSVASPFTSKEPNISCVPKVIMEGRAALVTSFGVFKLMLCYSLTEFASVIILYAIDTNLTSLQFLFIDIFLILNFASFFGKTEAYQKLDKHTPMASLLSFIPLTSIILFMMMVIVFQLFTYYFIQTYSWFEPFAFNPNDTVFYSCYENYAVFTVSMFQYVTMAVVFSKGKPYRRPIYTNTIFMLSILLVVVVCSYIALGPVSWLVNALELKMPPFYDARAAMLEIALVNFVVCVLVEDVLVERMLNRLVAKRLEALDKAKKYLKIEEELRGDHTWPMVRHSVAQIELIDEGNIGGRLETTKL